MKLNRLTLWSAALALLLLASPALADRSGGFALSFSTLENVVHDARGRVLERTVEEFDPAGDLRAIRTTANTYQDRYLVSSAMTQTDPDGVMLHTRQTQWTRDAKGQMTTMRRRWANADGDQTRAELATWEHERTANNRSVLITTVVRGAQICASGNEHLETRYAIQTWDRSRLVSSDTSIFDPDSQQTARHLTEYSTTGLQRWSFDAADEVTRRQVEVHHKSARGQLQYVEAEVFDGADVLTRSWDQRLVRRGDGRIQSDVKTWYDADGQGIRRRTTSHAWDGRSRHPMSRVRWEHWAD
ncbi:MAG: hypothetical protein ACI9WU_003598 [Myxococcota bacterium]|jgi:hypothetical protein